VVADEEVLMRTGVLMGAKGGGIRAGGGGGPLGCWAAP